MLTAVHVSGRGNSSLGKTVTDPLVDVQKLVEELRHFAAERDWEQFHTAKNLAMALAGEVGELLAEIQWIEADDLRSRLTTDDELRESFGSELADVFIYLVRLADVAGIDVDTAVRAKLEVNAKKYPPSRS